MSVEIQKRDDELILSNENIQNASALLALMHGKSDSICRLFNKEVIIDKNQLYQLNKKIIEKLSLNQVNAMTTSIDISLKNSTTISFKTWDEFEKNNWNSENSPTDTLFIQWDFFLNLNGFKIPQRHTLSLRISSSPNPSDFFKALINGGLDNSTNFDVKIATMICKIDFINNTLAEELLHIVEVWDNLCECAISKVGRIRPVLFIYRKAIAKTCELFVLLTISLLLAISVKLVIYNHLIVVTKENLFYALIFYIPVYFASLTVSGWFGNKTYSKLEDIMETHIFRITKGDEKHSIQIEHNLNYQKEIFLFISNIILSIVLSIIFYKI